MSKQLVFFGIFALVFTIFVTLNTKDLLPPIWSILNTNKTILSLVRHSIKTVSTTEVLFQKLTQNYSAEWSELLNIVLSSPWLFPKSQTLFPYLGLHNDLDALLHTMTYPSTKKILVLGFSWHWQAMLQNNIFTLVRFTRTTNYIVATGDELTLSVCIELNLPCYNASSYMAKLKRNVSIVHQGLFNDPYYLAIVWFKTALYLDILRKGFTVMKSDTDISYASKNIWKVFESMAEKTGADLIFMRENPVNTGQFYAIPNERVIAFFEEWLASEGFLKTLNDQEALQYLNKKTYMICNSMESCSRVKSLPMNHSSDYDLRDNHRKANMTAVLTYPSSFAQFGNLCPPNKVMNPCDPQTLYVHTICMTSNEVKINKLKQLGFWLMTDPCTQVKFDAYFKSSKSEDVSIIRCVPIPRVWPTVESSFLNCNNSEYPVVV